MDSFEKYLSPDMLSLSDSYAVKILICFFLKQIDRPVTPKQLTEIATDDGIVNYFLYTEAIDSMLQTGIIKSKIIDNVEYYVLTEAGKSGADDFKTIVPRSFRDKILSSGLKLFAKLKYEHDVSCTVSKGEKGYIIDCVCKDMDVVLLDMKLYAPDLEQANLIKEKILLNPSDFYGKILDYALDNKEYEPDISDL